MCGDISKHNVLRSVGVAEELQQTLVASGVSVELEDAMLALGDFYERFHMDILNYHSSTIAEFLNNIRWGIYEYLQPEFRRSIVWEGGNRRKWRALNSGEHEPSDDPMARKQLLCLSILRHRGVAHVDHGVLDIRVP